MSIKKLNVGDEIMIHGGRNLFRIGRIESFDNTTANQFCTVRLRSATSGRLLARGLAYLPTSYCRSIDAYTALESMRAARKAARAARGTRAATVAAGII